MCIFGDQDGPAGWIDVSQMHCLCEVDTFQSLGMSVSADGDGEGVKLMISVFARED